MFKLDESGHSVVKLSHMRLTYAQVGKKDYEDREGKKRFGLED